jgi:hypothetical protein
MKLDVLMRFVSRSVRTGFVNALAILIFSAQVPQMLGVTWHTYAMIAGGLAIIYLMPRISTAIPSPLVCILILTAISITLPMPIHTVADLGRLPSSLPSFTLPAVPLDWQTLRIVAPYALAMAAVGLLESMMTASVAGGSAKSRTALGLTAKASVDPRLAGLNLDKLLHGGLKPDADLLARWAAGLSPKECVEAMNSLQGLPAGEPRDDILKAVVTALAENDPKGFLASTSSVANAKLRENGVSSALQKLGAENPQEALSWIKQNSADSSTADLSKRYESALSGYATIDPAGALNAAMALPADNRNDTQVKSRAMEGIAEGMSSQGQFTQAIAMFSQLPADKFQNDGLARVADLWAVAAPQDTANWINGVTNPQLQNDLGQSLTDVWRNTDPQSAAAWALQIDQAAAASGAAVGSNYNGNGNNLDSLLTNVIDNWSKTDLNAAGQFLNQLPPSTVKDEAIASFASRAAQDNPAAAMGWVAVGLAVVAEVVVVTAAAGWEVVDLVAAD